MLPSPGLAERTADQSIEAEIRDDRSFALNSGSVLMRKVLPGFGFLLILAALAGYAAGVLQLPERESGEININTNPPGATIFVDGMHRGSTPLRVSGLRPGTHQLRAVMPGYRGVVLQVEVLPSRKDSLDWMLEPAVPETLHKQLALGPAASSAAPTTSRALDHV